MFKKIIIGIV